MVAVPDLSCEQSGFGISQCRAHRLKALSELDEQLLKSIFGETSLQQPRAKMLERLAVEGAFLPVMGALKLVELAGDIFIFNRSARSGLQEPIPRPQVIWNAVCS